MKYYSRINRDIPGTTVRDSEANESETKQWLPVLGFIYVAASGVCFAVMMTTIKWFNSLSPFSWAFYRSFVNFLLNAMALLWQGVPITDWFGTERRQVKFLSLRALFGVGGMNLGFTAYQLLELGDASCFRQSVPVWACLFGYFLLHEKLDLTEICIIAWIMFGLVIVSRPSFLFGNSIRGSKFIYGATAGLCSAIFSALAFTFIKKVKQVQPNTPNFVIVNWLMCGAMILTYPISLITKTSFQLVEGWQIVGVCFGGFFGFLGQYLLTAGIGLERVGPVMSIRSSDIILMFLFQGLIWGFDTRGLVYSIVGAIAIVSGTISLGVHKWKKTTWDTLELEAELDRELELTNVKSGAATIPDEARINESLLRSIDNEGDDDGEILSVASERSSSELLISKVTLDE